MKGLALSLYFFSTVAGAQQVMTLDEAVSAALANHPRLAEGRERIESARGQRRQAGLYRNPKFVFFLENARLPGDTPIVYGRDVELFAYLQQPVETGGKRVKRVELSSRELRSAELEIDVLKTHVTRDVRLAYWAAAGAQHLFELLLENQKTFQQIVEYHEIRVREGAMAESDLLRVRLEAERIALAANNARLDAARARIELFRRMGQTTFPEVRLAEPLEVAEDRLILCEVEEALNRRPEVELARSRLQQACANQTLQHANARPDWDVMFGYKRTSGLNTMMGGFQVDLPLFNRNQGSIESASSDIKVAEASLAATEAIVRAEVSAAQVEYETRRRQVRELMGRFREQAAESSKIAQAAYRLGGADLLRLLDAERLRIEIDQLSYRALTEYRQSIVTLEAALGKQP